MLCEVVGYNVCHLCLYVPFVSLFYLIHLGLIILKNFLFLCNV